MSGWLVCWLWALIFWNSGPVCWPCVLIFWISDSLLHFRVGHEILCVIVHLPCSMSLVIYWRGVQHTRDGIFGGVYNSERCMSWVFHIAFERRNELWCGADNLFLLSIRKIFFWEWFFFYLYLYFYTLIPMQILSQCVLFWHFQGSLRDVVPSWAANPWSWHLQGSAALIQCPRARSLPIGRNSLYYITLQFFLR